MAAEPSSVSLVDDADIADIVMTDEEYWRLFDETAQRNAGVSGMEFIRRVRLGEIVNDDSVAGITFLFMLLPGVPEARRNA